MLGICITLFFGFCMVGFGLFLYGRWLACLDAFAQWGIAGMLGLATVGLLTLLVGLLPNGLIWGMGVVWVFAAIGLGKLIRLKARVPKSESQVSSAESGGPEERRESSGTKSASLTDLAAPNNLTPNHHNVLIWLFFAAVGIAILFALFACDSPSGSLDWDTIAYHLAVPKLWLQAGHIYPIPFIHHSNFPLSVDNLYIWGLAWGGQYGAKAFELAFYILGLLAVFGITRGRYGEKAAAWAALTFATVPAVLWEAGTGYIDVAHGLFTAFGAILTVQMLHQIWASKTFATSDHSEQHETSEPSCPPIPNDRHPASLWPIAALCFGFSAGSKYTGLETMLVAGLVFGAYILFARHGSGFGKLCAIFGVALVVCAPWYIKNELWVGNPVYPFFYEQLGGKHWDEYNATIYKNQQQTFGVPRTGPAAGLANFPDSVLGLAFQPSRYTDPDPVLDTSGPQPTGAEGFPWQATGAAIVISGLIWMLSGRIGRYEGLLLVWVGVSFLLWFVLSQQSRYALDFAPILAILLGAGVLRLRAGPILAATAVVQALFTLGLLYFTQFQLNSPVVLGKETAGQYLAEVLPSHKAFDWLNQNVGNGRVALYDEVFGYYLNVPYFWANPGHTTLIGYDKLNSGSEYVARMKQMGFTYIYMSLAYGSYRRDQALELRNAMGLQGPAVPFTAQAQEQLLADPGQKYKFLIADATEKGLLTPAADFGSGFILKIR